MLAIDLSVAVGMFRRSAASRPLFIGLLFIHRARPSKCIHNSAAGRREKVDLAERMVYYS